ncbi:MAG: phosphatase PAP2 family protein [Polyangiaceae bacterium]|nr:phosphatase PAP2 family protein [Polyangiaceae bacterium]
MEPLPLAFVGESAVPPLEMIGTGADHRLRVIGQRDLGGRPGLEDASLYAPYVLAGGALVGAELAVLHGACRWARPQAAIAQAMGLTAATTLVLKWAAGRNWPNAGLDPSMPDRLEHPERARDFQPFAWRMSAWPSGHTATLVAAAAALRTSLPELGWAAWLGYPVAGAVAAGMWLNDRHWASDILSGVLIGEAVGSSVGKSFATEPARSGSWWVQRTRNGGLVLGYWSSW